LTVGVEGLVRDDPQSKRLVAGLRLNQILIVAPWTVTGRH
jgi:hypothetical protein